MKKTFAILGTAVMSGVIALSGITAFAEDTVKLSLLHYQEQYQEAFDNLLAMYKEVAPNVEIEMEIIGSDYDKVLQTRVASGETPDIFMTGPFNKNELYKSVSYNMDGQAFLDEITLGDEYVASNGERTGIPFSTQSWGVLYNKDVFEAAGIETLPQTIDELKSVCETLKEAGYTPFAVGAKSNYVKNQFFGFTYAVDDNYAENIAKLSAKEASLTDFDFINKIFDAAEVVKANCQENPFNDDFSSAASMLGLGDTAMMVCGDWVVENALKANPDARIGIFGLPMSDDPADCKIYAAASTGLHVNKDSEHVEEALAFLEWLVSTTEGKDWLSNDMKVLSSIKGVYPESSEVLMDAQALIDEGKSGMWASYLFPSGIDNDLSPIYDQFLLDEISREDAIAELAEVWNTFE